MKPITIATRKSRLALWQSEHVADGLRRHWPDIAVELLPMSTRGDEVLDRSLAEIGGKGLFLKELEKALLDGRADLAVHSLKDVPAEQPEGLALSAYLPRANPVDLWISASATPILSLAGGSCVGSSSLRRVSQLRAIRPDVETVALRGNVETRIAAVTEGRVDATVLAAAGLERLDIVPGGAIALRAPDWLPAPGQGIIAIQHRADDSRTAELIARLDCPRTRRQALAEREIVRVLGGDCTMPLAAFAEISGSEMTLRGRLGDHDGALIDAEARGDPGQATDLGAEVARNLLENGGRELLARLNRS
jgi:hydroxymethylbilane synthase